MGRADPQGAGATAPTRRRPARLSRIGLWVLLALGYYLAAQIGLAFRFQDSHIGVVWPANAVLLAALLLAPTRHWRVVFLVTALAHIAALSPSTPAWRLLWQIVGNSTFTAATVFALRRFAGLPLTFGSPRQVVAYISVVFGMSLLFGLVTPAFV